MLWPSTLLFARLSLSQGHYTCLPEHQPCPSSSRVASLDRCSSVCSVMPCFVPLPCSAACSASLSPPPLLCNTQITPAKPSWSMFEFESKTELLQQVECQVSFLHQQIMFSPKRHLPSLNHIRQNTHIIHNVAINIAYSPNCCKLRTQRVLYTYIYYTNSFTDTLITKHYISIKA